MTVIDLARFDGGLNLRDSLDLLALNETPDALNMTLTTRGSVRVRNGCTNVVALPGVSGTAAFIFYSAALTQWLCARETSGAPNTLKLYSRPGDLSGSWTDRGTINSSTSAQASFVDFPGNPPKVVIATDINSGATKGIWTWDGTTLTNVSSTVVGTAIALWQNRAWVVGYPTSDANGNPTRMFYSAIGDPTTWSATGQFNDVRDKNAAALVSLGIVGGALVVFKKRSAYRVNDSNTGFYTTIDPGVGAIGPRAVTAVSGRLVVWAPDGLYEFDGIGPGRNVGDKARPIFTDILAIDTESATSKLVAAAGFEDRAIFAFPRISGGAFASDASQLLEYSPGHGWLMRHQLAASGQDGITSFANKDGVLYAAVIDGDDLFSMFTASPGADDGANFTSNIKAAVLNRGTRHRLQRCRAWGSSAAAASSTKEIRTYLDWGSSVTDTFDITTAIETSDGEEAIDLRGLGQAEAFQLEFRCSGGTGAAELDRLRLDLTRLAA